MHQKCQRLFFSVITGFNCYRATLCYEEYKKEEAEEDNDDHDEEILHRLLRSVDRELIPFCGALSQRWLLDSIKPATEDHYEAVLETAYSVTHNSPFLPYRWPKPLPVFIVPTHGVTVMVSWHCGWLHIADSHPSQY